MSLALTFSTLLQLAGACLPAEAPPQASAPPRLDLSLHGFPLEGQPLALEVRGPAGTPFLVLIDVVPGDGAEEAPATAIPGARAASEETKALAAGAPEPRTIRGTTDAGGLWRERFDAPGAGSRLLVSAFAAGDAAGDAGDAGGARVREVEALELDVLAAYAARPGDVTVAALPADERGEARVRLANRTAFELELGGWTLSDEHGGVQVLAEGTVLPAHGSVVLACGALPYGTELVLADEEGRAIHRSTRAGAGLAFGPGVPTGSGPAPIPCPSREDVPDLAFEDTNCDGIDGDVARAVFVATNGAPFNLGTIDQPLDDVNAAIALAASDPDRDHVYVSEGTYPGIVTLLDGVSVWGGYSRANGWARSGAYTTTFVGGSLPAGEIGVHAKDLAGPTVLGSVTIATAVPLTDRNNYGVLLQNSSQVTLEAVTVNAGPGGPAYDGSHGSNGAAGSRGGDGCGLDTCAGSGGSSPLGQTGGNGGVGGFFFGGSNGSSGVGPSPGAGGTGGSYPGGSGQPGSDGGNGTGGNHGSALLNSGTIISGWWESLSEGGNGSSGAPGSGGGGGGGGAANVFYVGTGGGGGGGGGAGGHGGTGGGPGGSSFALFLSSSDVTVRACNLAAGAGSPGGTGGNGGSGGDGGARGFGGFISNAGAGANGGFGGKGGNGGGGAGGGGGHSYAILVGPSSTYTIETSTLSTSSAGPGGIGGIRPASNQAPTGLPGEALPLKQL